MPPTEATQTYFRQLEEHIQLNYDVANEARKKGLDPRDEVEIPLAKSLAEKCVGLIATIYPQMMGTGIAARILELEKEHGKLDPAVCLGIAEEVAKQKFCKFENLLEAITAGARIGFAYITLGVVSSPIEGLTDIKTGTRADGKEYLILYYSGPVRSAGGTGAAFSVVIIDYLRELFGFAKYDPTEEEVRRFVSEINDYHERITNLQYHPHEQEIELLAKNIPVQINGEASEKLEVSNYKNLERVETDYIRSGVCLTFAEGVAQKAPKIKRYVDGLRKKGFQISDWDFLGDYVALHAELEKKGASKKAGDATPTYIKDLVAGRPVYGHPSRSGAFRFRYGRGRTSGFSAASVHPATMAVTDDFIAIGTQLKIEKPTKGCAVTSCDLIEGPIVKLRNGSVRQLSTKQDARELYKDIEEIIYLGDILFPFSDLANRNYALIKPGYVEEWWEHELRVVRKKPKMDPYHVDFSRACALSDTYGVPLYPKYIFYWTQITREEFSAFIAWLALSRVRGGKLIFPYSKKDRDASHYDVAKRALELLGVSHEVTLEHVVLDELTTQSLFVNLGLDLQLLKNEDVSLKSPVSNFIINKDMTVLEMVNVLSPYRIKDKAGDFIGTRMGRPEKAKLRKLAGSPHVLFPVGNEGGRLRSVQAAIDEGKVKSSFPLYFCEHCQQEGIFRSCGICGRPMQKRYYCRKCQQTFFTRDCPQHGPASPHGFMELPIGEYYLRAKEKLGLRNEEMPPLVKGVRGTSSSDHSCEHLAKGILRALFNVHVNKDGTTRFDATELPLTHFTPREISAPYAKLRELGYTHDVEGNPLENDDQILELKPHDVVLPCSPDTPDERADGVFLNVTRFVDALLERFYGLNKFYNYSSKEDLIGTLGVCMAPHNCAGVICRFIGFSQTQGLLASPYMHAAIRRDCDGDEAAVMLLMDVLLNFSLSFLPSHRGGTQDAPLVLNGKIDAGEVDDQILDFEMVEEYPLELYQLAEQRKHSSEIYDKIRTVKQCLKEDDDPFVGVYFTHTTGNFNDGVWCSSYKKFATMQEKVQHQMELVERIRAVDTSDTAKLVIERHFIRDMRGNLRKFSMQGFRCVACNESLRRPPLSGVCPACGGKIIFTIHEGGIKKYLEPALQLAETYNLSNYMKQSLEVTKRYIDSVFGKDAEKQEALAKWF